MWLSAFFMMWIVIYNLQFFINFNGLFDNSEIEIAFKLLNLLFYMKKPLKNEIRKPTKTISGITPVAVMLPPRKCEHGCCVFCPQLNVTQSYTPKSPVFMRAERVDFDSRKQVEARLKAFRAMNHPIEKVEIIIMGGTFLEYPDEFQEEFIKGIYDGLNEKKSKYLINAQNLNERAKQRCVAMCVETRPDKCVNFISKMRKWGVTRVELGVQIIDDKIYELVKRGHKIKDVVETTKALKNAGFKVGYHIMPGLPGSNMKKDMRLFKKLFSDERFKPDQLKIYPCQVIPKAELENWYWNKKYKPYNTKEIRKILLHMIKLTPRYCRIMRVMREIPPEYVVAGTIRIDLRKEVEKELRERKVKVKEIRFREIGFFIPSSSPDPPARRREKINNELELKITKYKASGCNEYFLEIVNRNDILFGLLRLRVVNNKKFEGKGMCAGKVNEEEILDINECISDEKKEYSGSEVKCAGKLSNLKKNVLIDKKVENPSKVGFGAYGKIGMVRELHVYGKALDLGVKGKLGKEGQHAGLGKWLMGEAEKICKKEKCKSVRVISGVGVREYYKNLGYSFVRGNGDYMVKYL